MKPSFKKALFAICTFLLCSVQLTYAQQSYDFQNPKLSFEERAKDLINQLTLEEKALLMINDSPAIERLNIPSYDWWNEALHGIGRAGKATVFPQAIGLAATFDPALINDVATVISDEARAKHNAALAKGNRKGYLGLNFWSPNINIFRDPRWGRGQETYGEDPFLTAQLGVAFVKGLQGDDPTYLKAAACAKHFAVHSGPEAVRHSFNALPVARDYRETYLPAFKALSDVGVESFMCAYNRLDSLACCGSVPLLKDLLRDDWGFKGHIVSDCGAFLDFFNFHKISEGKVDATVLGIQAGVNLNCGSTYLAIPKAVEEGLITEAQVDEVIFPLLMTRFKLGLFDPQIQDNPYNKISPSIVDNASNRNVAYQAALKSLVLLQNKNNVLPLDETKLKKIFVSGPTSNDNIALVGNYNGWSSQMTTVLEGMISRTNPGTIVDFAQGTYLKTDNDNYNGFWHMRDAEAVIVGLGLNRFLEGEDGDAMLAEAGDREELKLPANQIDYLKELRAKKPNTPIIVVLTGGSTLDISDIEPLADAIIMSWYPGEEGGNAVADVILGNENPAGRLPLTFYKSVDDLPAFDDYSMQGRTYRFFDGEVAYPFGFGLSYTTFGYNSVHLIKEALKAKSDKKLNFVVSVSNTGDVDGEEVVQCYIRYNDAVEGDPIKNMKAFERVMIAAGDTKKLAFEINLDDIRFWNTDKDAFELRKGTYTLEVGSSSRDIKIQKTFTIK